MDHRTARAIVKWFRNADPRSIRALGAHICIRTMGQRAGLVHTHFIERFGAQAFLVCEGGVGILEAIARAEFEMAGAVLRAKKGAAMRNAKKPSPKPQPAPNAVEIQAPQAALPPPEPPKGVRWTVCEAVPEPPKPACPPANNKQAETDFIKYRKAIVEKRERWLPYVNPTNIENVESLKERFPHFEVAVTAIVRHLRYRMATKQALKLPAMCVNGPPGNGKTEFFSMLGQALDMPMKVASFAEMTASWLLTGGSRMWRDSGPGMVVKSLLDLPDGKAPLIFLDELDKARGYGDKSIDVSLLGLLEATTAKQFTDEFIDMKVNAHPISWAFASNDSTYINPALFSRLLMLDIHLPIPAQMPAVVKSVERAFRESEPELARLFEPLSDPIIDRLTVMPTRMLKRLMEDMFAIAIERFKGDTERIAVTQADLNRALAELPLDKGHRRIGFIH